MEVSRARVITGFVVLSFLVSKPEEINLEPEP